MFNDYYAKYLSVNNGTILNNCLVCKSENRDIPLNKRYIYRIIISDYNSERVISVSQTISASEIYNMTADISDIVFDDILESRQLSKTGLRLSKMYRMVLDNENTFHNSLSGNLTCEYIKDYQKYVIRDNDQIVSYCKISNIDFEYGNIVVWTDENYRRKGFARELLLMIITKCKTEGIEPVYLVNSRNIASLELAKSVGFKVAQTEIIACEVTGL